MSNSFLEDSYKSRLRAAARKGRSSSSSAVSNGKDSCSRNFPCPQLDHTILSNAAKLKQD